MGRRSARGSSAGFADFVPLLYHTRLHGLPIWCKQGDCQPVPAADRRFGRAGSWGQTINPDQPRGSRSVDYRRHGATNPETLPQAAVLVFWQQDNDTPSKLKSPSRSRAASSAFPSLCPVAFMISKSAAGDRRCQRTPMSTPTVVTKGSRKTMPPSKSRTRKPRKAAYQRITRLQPCPQPFSRACRTSDRPVQVIPHSVRKIPLSKKPIRCQNQHRGWYHQLGGWVLRNNPPGEL
jgi:hypothetical protein